LGYSTLKVKKNCFCFSGTAGQTLVAVAGGDGNNGMQSWFEFLLTNGLGQVSLG
jgi:hypothetical protein